MKITIDTVALLDPLARAWRNVSAAPARNLRCGRWLSE